VERREGGGIELRDLQPGLLLSATDRVLRRISGLQLFSSTLAPAAAFSDLRINLLPATPHDERADQRIDVHRDI
jgi:hypothetical protein